ncbi:MAG: hypothetical protein KGJ35_00025 [Patescibacteria group bacterium]|nr:hypothetical protein [Patescibacteria group bacterium]
MIFVTPEFVESELRKNKVQHVLWKHGKKRVAPGFTVADYIKIGEFFVNAGDYPKREKLV